MNMNNNNNNATQQQVKPNPSSKPNEQGNISVQGHIKIYDPVSKEVFVDKRNAIHYENLSLIHI